MSESGMPRSRAAKVDDPRKTRVENELLTAEVHRLRQELAKLRSTAAGRWATEEIKDDTDRELGAEALADMRQLLTRLGSNPLGKVVLSRPGFRALLEKYGPDAQ